MTRRSRLLGLLVVCFCWAGLTPSALVDGLPRDTVHDCFESGHPADVFFLLDASNSIWGPDFQRQLSFVKEISRMFRIGRHHTQIGVITYADYPQLQFHLNYYQTSSDIMAAIDNIRQNGGYRTSTADALRYLRERGFSNRVATAHTAHRGNVTRVGIVITDGNSDDTTRTVAQAQLTKDMGIHLFAVGVGINLDLEELEAIASSPAGYYTFQVESYSGLENIKHLLAIKTCTVTDPPPTTTTTTTTVATTTEFSSTSEISGFRDRTPSSKDNPNDPQQPLREEDADDYHPLKNKETEHVNDPNPDTSSSGSSQERGRQQEEDEDHGHNGNRHGRRNHTSGMDSPYEKHRERERNRSTGSDHEDHESRPGGDGGDDVDQGPSTVRPDGDGRPTPGVEVDLDIVNERDRKWGERVDHEDEEVPPVNLEQGGEDEQLERTPMPDSAFEWVYDTKRNRWIRRRREWPDARQDGHWSRDERGNPVWVYDEEPHVVPIYTPGSTEIPLPGEEVGGGPGSDYEVQPVDEFSQPNGGHKERPNKNQRGHPRHGSDGNVTHKKKQNGSKPITGCKPKSPLDVVFVVDAKNHDKRSRKQLWDAVRNVVDQVDMDNGKMRVQFVQSCSKMDRLWKSRVSKKNDILGALGDMAAGPASKTTADLIQTMTTKLTANGKPGRKKIGVYLTNGQSGDLENTLQAVQNAKTVHGIEMFSVGLGTDINPVELQAIASCEAPKHSFSQRHHSKFKEIYKQLSKSLCSVR